MNITAMVNNTINISRGMLTNTRYCEVLEVHLDYNLFITANFIFFMVAFLEMKKGVLTKLEMDTKIEVKRIYLISMIVFNVCMFLFQFILKPLTIVVGG